MPQLLLELFSEEIPARMQGQAARDLERMARERLADAGLLPEALTAFAGPRRLTLVVEGLAARQSDRHEEIKGPRASAPPQALEGFLRKTGLAREQLAKRDGVLYAHLHRPGRATAEIVADMVPAIVRAFPWPKSMTSGESALRWVRPLQRILCLFDGEVVPFSIDGIASGDLTEGHRFMGSGGKPIRVRDFDSYRDALEREFVVLDAADRRARIAEGCRTLAFARNLAWLQDEGLLEETAGLAEWPVPVLGHMDPAFLDLPPEVIRTSMRIHQRYFAVTPQEAAGAAGAPQALAPHFITVANIEARDGGRTIAAGNAKVLSARLSDARFFWDEDRAPDATGAANFDRWLRKLEGVTFHAKLGTMAERAGRIEALALEIAGALGYAEEQTAQVREAARLCKADLASGMVGEFPELQGVMGGYYARAAGLPDPVADAIRDHYKPLGPSDTVPTAPVTVAVALADKLDTLAGFFAIDEKPTGSKDPYALRRAALGVIRLLLENSLRVSVDRLFDVQVLRHQIGPDAQAADTLSDILAAAALHGLYGAPTRERISAAEASAPGWLGRVRDHDPSVSDGLRAFLHERLKVLLREQNVRQDVIDACLGMPNACDLVLLVGRADALTAFLATDDGANLLAGYKRAANILRAEGKKGPLPEGAPERLPGAPAEETALLDALDAARPPVEQALAEERFADAMTALAALRAPVDSFFDKVLVNSDVPAERDNRLRLLEAVRSLMNRVADFSQIGG